VKAEQKSTV